MRILTEADYIALANLCQASSTLSKAQDQLNKAGLLCKTKSGYVQQSPLLSIVNSSTDIVMRHLREFGSRRRRERACRSVAISGKKMMSF